MMTSDIAVLNELFRRAVQAADPGAALARNLPADRSSPCIVVGAGKAAARMASELERSWNGPLRGVVVVPYGFRQDCRTIEVLEASHPVPDHNGLVAARRLVSSVSGLGADDLVIALVSGGGSALLPLPPAGMSLEDEVILNQALLASGAPISAMNAIRKQVSSIKGGRLALAAAPARVVTYVLSDVPGDDPAQVASGPTIPDLNGADEALEYLDRYQVGATGQTRGHVRSRADPPPMPDHPAFAAHEVHVIASARMSLVAAAGAAREFGLEPVILSDSIEGEAREAGRVMAAIAREIAVHDQPFSKPVVLLSGGETTVTLARKGRGGRNSEFLLSLALAIDGLPGITALAADTDGIDGTETNAGAVASGTTVAEISKCGLNAATLLHRNDSYLAFEAIDALFETGPTGTNVNDFRAIIIRQQ